MGIKALRLLVQAMVIVVSSKDELSVKNQTSSQEKVRMLCRWASSMNLLLQPVTFP